MKSVGHEPHMRNNRNACRILVESEGKIQLGKPTHRLKVNMKTGLRETGLDGMDLIH
jgi:hypothetical protein